MTEWIQEVRKKGYTISPYSDRKDLAAEVLQELRDKEERMPARELSAED